VAKKEIEIKDAEDLSKVLTRHDGALEDQDKRLVEALAGLGAVKDIGDKVGALDTALGEVKEQIKNGFRKVHFGDNGREERDLVTEEEWGRMGVMAMHKSPTAVKRTDSYQWEDAESAVARFQDESDSLYLVRSVFKLTEEQTRAHPLYKSRFRPALEKAIGLHKEAFDTVDAGAGLEWVPTEFSSRFFDKVRLELNVVALFEQFSMPRGTFVFPVQLADLTVYTFAENTSHTGQTPVVDGLGSTNVTGNRTFTAIGLGCRAFTSRFWEEDSVIEVLGFLQRASVQAMRNGLESAVVNGDTTATHQDNDIAGVTAHAAKAWIGLRKGARNSTATFDNSGSKVNTRALFMDSIMKVRSLMGVYGANVNDLAMVTSVGGAVQLLQVESFDTAASLVAGTGTNVNGELRFRPYGIQHVTSEFMKENLASTGVNTVGGPNTFTGMVVVNKRAWMLGNLRNITIEILRERYAEEDQDVVLIKWRGAFNSPYGTSTNHTGYVYDIGL
jgi:HK97 family phage major capsid protein